MKEFFRMLDKYGLLCLVVFLESLIALTALPGLLAVFGVAIIWMIPLYLGRNRVRRR